MQSLAIKYRPKSFDEVAEQSATKVILQQQLDSGEIKNAYLFCGGAGTGKTTCARIFANEINKGNGTPIELDAASNNSVDDVREIIQQSKTSALNSEYKVFIMDEVHALSNNAWQAMLKVLEEPPQKSVFIMCTTDPQKIPKTILSRVQRYDFQRIGQSAISNRLKHILEKEADEPEVYHIGVQQEALDYIAKIANGGMRDAITMLDKCLAYSADITMENVIQALGLSDYSVMTDFVDETINGNSDRCIEILNSVYMQGKDLKQFMRSLTDFVLEIYKFKLMVDRKYINLPTTKEMTEFVETSTLSPDSQLLTSLIKLNQEIKWDVNPKARIEAWIITGE